MEMTKRLLLSRMRLLLLLSCLAAAVWGQVALASQDPDEPEYQPEQPPLNIDQMQPEIDFDAYEGPEQPPVDKDGNALPAYLEIQGSRVAVMYDSEGHPIQPPIDRSSGGGKLHFIGAEGEADPSLREYYEAVQRLKNPERRGESSGASQRVSVMDTRRRRSRQLGDAQFQGTGFGSSQRARVAAAAQNLGRWVGWGVESEEGGAQVGGGSPLVVKMPLGAPTASWWPVAALLVVLVAGGCCINFVCRKAIMVPFRPSNTSKVMPGRFGTRRDGSHHPSEDYAATGSAVDQLRVRVMGNQNGMKKLDACC